MKGIKSFQDMKKLEEEKLLRGEFRDIYELRRRLIINRLTGSDAISATALAKELGCHRNTIRNLVKDYENFKKTGESSQIRRGAPEKYDDDLWAMVDEMYDEGYSLGEISRETGIPKTTIWDYLVKFS